MRCCHADFATVEGSDRGFTLGMPTFTFGSGVLHEAGEQARELGMRRVGLFTDRSLAASEHVAKVKVALDAAGVDAAVYDEVQIEPPIAGSPTRRGSQPRGASTASSRSAAAR